MNDRRRMQETRTARFHASPSAAWIRIVIERASSNPSAPLPHRHSAPSALPIAASSVPPVPASSEPNVVATVPDPASTAPARIGASPAPRALVPFGLHESQTEKYEMSFCFHIKPHSEQSYKT